MPWPPFATERSKGNRRPDEWLGLNNDRSILSGFRSPLGALPLADHPTLHPTPTPYSIIALLYTLTSGFSATTDAFNSRVRTLTSQVGSIGAPTTIVTPRR